MKSQLKAEQLIYSINEKINGLVHMRIVLDRLTTFIILILSGFATVPF